jgi:hypothetical protein
MVLFNYTTKEMTAKIVYYGPGLCGKTTNLQYIYESLPPQVRKGKMLSLATKTDRTLFFDFLPLELGKIRGMKTRIQLYTVPGQVFYNSTRKLVLKGADGIVFVADSQQKMTDSNLESYKNLEDNLREIGLKLEEMPLVMQFNKRDLPNLASVEEMNTLINRHNAPFYEAVATTGIGIEDTLKAITKLVLNHLAAKYNLEAPAETARQEGTPADLSAPAPSGLAASPGPGTLGVEEDTPELEIERWGEPPSAGAHAASSETGDGEGGDPDRFEILEETEETSPDRVAGPESAVDDEIGELLEEIPEAEDDLEILDEPAPPPDRPAAAPAGPRPVPIPPPTPPRAGPPTPEPARRAAPVPPPPQTPEESISPVDPLGLGGAREGAMPLARSIQIGAVSPGREHRFTVPLEMSVEGRRVRLNLRMTLTVTE